MMEIAYLHITFENLFSFFACEHLLFIVGFMFMYEILQMAVIFPYLKLQCTFDHWVKHIHQIICCSLCERLQKKTNIYFINKLFYSYLKFFAFIHYGRFKLMNCDTYLYHQREAKSRLKMQLLSVFSTGTLYPTSCIINYLRQSLSLHLSSLFKEKFSISQVESLERYWQYWFCFRNRIQMLFYKSNSRSLKSIILKS